VPFYVHARDRSVGAELLDLAEAHWASMDRFAGRLLLRGETLFDDGTEHTGSVHVVDLADRTSAERFATEEPYWLAGLPAGHDGPSGRAAPPRTRRGLARPGHYPASWRRCWMNAGPLGVPTPVMLS
jgi:uncharacterized protein YciI